MRDNLHDVDGQKVNIQEALVEPDLQEFVERVAAAIANQPVRHVFMCGTYQQAKYYMHEMNLGRKAADRKHVFYVSADMMLHGFVRRPQDKIYVLGTFWERRDCYQLVKSALIAGFTPKELGLEEEVEDGERTEK